MGLTKRKDSYYVEFRVIDDGTCLKLATGGGGQLKRWKVGSRNKEAARHQEAIHRTKLLTGQLPSAAKARAESVTFRQWADEYLHLESVTRLRSYAIRKVYVENLVEFFGQKPLGAITPQDVRQYRAQRVRYRRIACPRCRAQPQRGAAQAPPRVRIVGRRTCGVCGWERQDAGVPASIQTINHDHMTLIHMLNVAKSPRYRLITDNPAEHEPKANPQNERDRIATADEWHRLLQAAAPHLRGILTVLYGIGPRKGELLKLEWPDVDLSRREFTLRHTKNGETRVVPMTPQVHHVFVECWRGRRLDTQRVFLYKERPVQRLGTAFKAACRRAGIIGLRLHDLRHTATTNLRRAGVDTATAMKIVGHKSDRMHRRYNTIEPDDLHAAVAKLHAYQANTVITPPHLAPEPEHVSA